MEPGGITLPSGLEIPGEHLVLITAIYADAKAWVVHTAVDDADIVGSHSIFHGPDPVTVGRPRRGGDSEVVYSGER